jgi:hypothetical protein
MTNQLSRRLLLSALGTAPFSNLLAADFWQQKKFTDWNEKEITKLLSDSPWARQVLASAEAGKGSSSGSKSGGGKSSGGNMGGGGGRGGGGRNAGGGMGGGGGMSGGGMSGGGMGGGGEMGGGGGGMSGGGMPSMSALVRWLSALPIRQALLKAQLGVEAATSLEARAMLEREDKEYVIALAGLPLRAARTSPDKLKASLKSKTALRRKGKDPIEPLSIDVKQSGQAFALIFRFPKKDAITLDDKEVEFTCQMGPAQFKRKFKLKDMVFEGNLAL